MPVGFHIIPNTPVTLETVQAAWAPGSIGGAVFVPWYDRVGVSHRPEGDYFDFFGLDETPGIHLAVMAADGATMLSLTEASPSVVLMPYIQLGKWSGNYEPTRPDGDTMSKLAQFACDLDVAIERHLARPDAPILDGLTRYDSP